ncbi:hypothetical protein KGF57_003664 [Candida theae]|uniref:Vta1 C-terminal domain-containing protein n=1 Tax=Candida theae TaxID=1198502 RepID=A0AAD5BDK4_9ASCO|nr:uncharacterized protein KGF57_003664 [Candida theae]KAI5955531.1 hypothetical protein KGF57_003664 [Candida theae]
MSISIDQIPDGLRPDKNVSPYIQRAIELEEAEPIISYYSKIFVLEYILNNKIHTKSKDNEEFTIKLLDDTESVKKDTEDEELHTVLNDKNLSFRYALKFAYGLFNSCLESLKTYRSENKSKLVTKFRAAMCFLNILEVFESSSNEIDLGAVFGSKITNWSDFEVVNKEKLKVLKYQLTKLVKDEIQVEENEPSSNADLEKELDEELQRLSTTQDVKDEEVESDTAESRHTGLNDETDTVLHTNDASKPHDTTDDLVGDSSSRHIDAENGIPGVNLPGAPHFKPDDDSDADENVKLPQAPKYLPTDDIGHINKSGTIQVFPPKSDQDGTDAPKAEVTSSKPTRVHEKPLSKENIKAILNRDDAVAQIQKHTKFANSALQFEDFNEAENQLVKGLELLRALKRQDEE